MRTIFCLLPFIFAQQLQAAEGTAQENKPLMRIFENHKIKQPYTMHYRTANKHQTAECFITADKQEHVQAIHAIFTSEQPLDEDGTDLPLESTKKTFVTKSCFNGKAEEYRLATLLYFLTSKTYDQITQLVFQMEPNATPSPHNLEPISSNDFFVCHSPLDEHLLTNIPAIQATLTPLIRAKKYQEAATLFFEQCPQVPIIVITDQSSD